MLKDPGGPLAEKLAPALGEGGPHDKRKNPALQPVTGGIPPPPNETPGLLFGSAAENPRGLYFFDFLGFILLKIGGGFEMGFGGVNWKFSGDFGLDSVQHPPPTANP